MLATMQQSILVVLVLFLAPAASSSAESAASSAKAWLQSHSPTDDQLADLKSSDPDSYAMVSTLLKKQSMGLIKVAPSEREPDEAFSAREAVHKSVVDPGAFNPQRASDKDEQSVNSMLEAVANLGGNKAKKMSLLRKRHHIDKAESSESDDPFAKDAALFGLNEITLHDAPEKQQAEVAPVRTAAVQQEIEDDDVAPVQQQAVVAPTKKKAKSNSYLAGLNLDLSGDFPDAHKKADKTNVNLLDSFSYNEEALMLQPRAEKAPKPEESVEPAPKKPAAFLKYLGITKKAPAPEEAAMAQPAPESNPYDVFSKSLLDD